MQQHRGEKLARKVHTAETTKQNPSGSQFLEGAEMFGTEKAAEESTVGVGFQDLFHETVDVRRGSSKESNNHARKSKPGK